MAQQGMLKQAATAFAIQCSQQKTNFQVIEMGMNPDSSNNQNIDSLVFGLSQKMQVVSSLLRQKICGEQASAFVHC